MQTCAIYFYPTLLVTNSNFGNCAFHYFRPFLRISAVDFAKRKTFCRFQTTGCVWLGWTLYIMGKKCPHSDAVRESQSAKDEKKCLQGPGPGQISMIVWVGALCVFCAWNFEPNLGICDDGQPRSLVIFLEIENENGSLGRDAIYVTICPFFSHITPRCSNWWLLDLFLMIGIWI